MPTINLLWEGLQIPPASSLNKVGAAADARQLTAVAANAPIPLVYGEDWLGGLVINVLPSGTNVVCQVLWCLQCDSVQEVQFNGAALPAGASVTHYTGSQSTADATVVAAMAARGITYTDTLAGLANSVFVIPQVAFTAASLEFTARIRGRKVYDPRTTQTVWSDNPGLCLADFVTSSAYGMGLTVNWSSVSTLADKNDALVGGAEKRRLLGVSFIQPAPVEDVLAALRVYAGAFAIPDPAGVRLLADEDGAAVASYAHASGQIAAISALQLRDQASAPTVVQVLYTDTTATPWREMVAEAAAAGVGTTLPRRVSQVRLPGIKRYTQAYREAVERLNKLRGADLRFDLEVFDLGIKHEVGDLVSVTHPVGLSAKLMRLAEPPELLRAGQWRLSLVEHDAAAYSNALPTAPAVPNPIISTPAAPPDVTSISVAVLSDGRRRFTVVVPTGYANLTAVEVRVVAGTSSSWAAMSLFRTVPYDPAIGTYTFEASEPVPGTWSFGAKAINTYGLVSAGTAFISGAVIGALGSTAVFNSAVNLLRNSDFTEYTGTNASITALKGWKGSGGTSIEFYRAISFFNIGLGGGAIEQTTNYADSPTLWQDFAASAGQVFEFSAYYSLHRCGGRFQVEWYNSSNTLLGSEWLEEKLVTGSNTAGWGGSLDSFLRFWAKAAAAPTNAAYGRLVFVKYPTNSGQANSYLFLQRVLVTVAPAGVTRETATPWIDGGTSVVDGQTLQNYTASNASVNLLSASGGVDVVNDSMCSVSFTPPEPCQLVVSLTGQGAGTLSGSSTSFTNEVCLFMTQNSVTTEIDVKVLPTSAGGAFSAAVPLPFALAGVFTAAKGQALTVGLRWRGNDQGWTSLDASVSRLQLTVESIAKG
ncbi:MAG TPA: phage tail protein [Burkholderiaceae bacterium]|nr:phage tail protein [Burkholderiaceae bacterium]